MAAVPTIAARSGLDASFELLVQTFDSIGCSGAFPLARRKPGEGEEPIACFLEAVGNRAVPQAPLAKESVAPLVDLLRRVGVDHVGVVGGELVMEPFGRVGERIAVLVHLMPSS